MEYEIHGPWILEVTMECHEVQQDINQMILEVKHVTPISDSLLEENKDQALLTVKRCFLELTWCSIVECNHSIEDK